MYSRNTQHRSGGSGLDEDLKEPVEPLVANGSRVADEEGQVATASTSPRPILAGLILRIASGFPVMEVPRVCSRACLGI